MFRSLIHKIPLMAFVAVSTLAALSMLEAKQSYDARKSARDQIAKSIFVLPHLASLL